MCEICTFHFKLLSQLAVSLDRVSSLSDRISAFDSSSSVHFELVFKLFNPIIDMFKRQEAPGYQVQCVSALGWRARLWSFS